MTAAPSLRARLARFAGHAGEFLVYAGLRRLPIGLASAIGARGLGALIRHGMPDVARRARANLRRLHPEWSEARREDVVARHIENLGRCMAEYGHLDRMAAAGRIDAVDLDRVKDLLRSGPVLFIALHTGNFEMPGEVLHAIGQRWSSFWLPPESPVRLWIAERVRARLGVHLLDPSIRGVLDGMHILASGGCVSIYGDEYRAGTMMAPLFGRPPHAGGNLTIAVKLARRSGARIVIGWCTRLEGAWFRTHIIGPVDLPPERHSGARLLDDIALLNGLIEPVVRAHLDQWYFLDNPIDGVVGPDAGALSPVDATRKSGLARSPT